MSKYALFLILVLGFPTLSWGQILVEDPGVPKKVGEKAARKYFVAREGSEGSRRPDSDLSAGPRHMNIYVGTYLNDKQHRWGRLSGEDDVGEWIAGVSYRIGEWVNSMDLYFRGELLTYDIDDKKPLKLSLMPVVAFPDARSGFPVYFGAGAGLGIFFSQAEDESDLTFDFNLMAGFRQSDLFDTFGLSFEVGYKGHIHLLSSGQFNGTYLSVGTVHEF